MKIIFGRLCAAVLKVNAPKCSFWLKDIPYLNYVITREGIKPDPRKVQGIMDLERPTTTTEARDLIGMVQYCREICPRRSHALSLLIEAASNLKGRKIFWNDALEKKLKS